MTPDDFQRALQSFLSALSAERDAGLNQLDVNRENAFSRINNRQNANGLLFSTQPAVQQTQVVAEDLQQRAQLNTNFAQTELSLNNSVLQALDQIRSLNEATQLLNERPF